MKKKNVFITGAAGFIGFHLMQQLHRRGDNVLGYDNFNDYYSPQLKRNREKILLQQGLQIIEGDICNSQQLASFLAAQGTTHLVHLAAQAGVRYSLVNPQAYVKANLEGFVSLLEVCRHIPNLKLIYASSSSVYGNNSSLQPFSEQDRTDHPVSLYGATKKSNELMAYAYHHLYGLSITGLRFFTVYGPWGRPDMAYYSFTKAILEGKAIDLFDDGKLKRDFTYIDDIVAGIIAAIDLSAPYELFNLGNHTPIEVGYFVEVIESALGKKAIKNFLPMQKGDVAATWADVAHAREKLNFSPLTSIEEGLVSFVRWYLSYC